MKRCHYPDPKCVCLNCAGMKSPDYPLSKRMTVLLEIISPIAILAVIVLWYLK